ncbi:hypothetical protein CYMTET_43872 [Cymbomonas tetramitiformis]|uniref:Uncharacterized protein n=1 Tax=Cymbomonas tetramitiformis TaxID=36881 RepID=A0AAE0C1C9_9CHLO|nr:hypothetical protein CYMTET_43872 [Cymbomonas tetramitiformis]
MTPHNTGKKPKAEANLADRGKDCGRTPPPKSSTEGVKSQNCKYCFRGGGHWDKPESCWTGCRSAKVPEGFHKKRMNSPHEHEAQNARIRMYNVNNKFANSEFGITVAEWYKLSEAQRGGSATPANKGKVEANMAASLAEELKGTQADMWKMTWWRTEGCARVYVGCAGQHSEDEELSDTPEEENSIPADMFDSVVINVKDRIMASGRTQYTTTSGKGGGSNDDAHCHALELYRGTNGGVDISTYGFTVDDGGDIVYLAPPCFANWTSFARILRSLTCETSPRSSRRVWFLLVVRRPADVAAVKALQVMREIHLRYPSAAHVAPPPLVPLANTQA